MECYKMHAHHEAPLKCPAPFPVPWGPPPVQAPRQHERLTCGLPDPVSDPVRSSKPAYSTKAGRW
jgi:hypothetical protein